MKNVIPAEAPPTATCYLWSISQLYDFKERGYIELTLQLARSICVTPFDNEWTNMIWIPVLNVMFSATSLVLIGKYFHEIVTVYNRMKRKYDSRKKVL